MRGTSIPLRTIQTLIDSIPRRIAEVIAAKGGTYKVLELALF
jgi:hypothetical protein